MSRTDIQPVEPVSESAALPLPPPAKRRRWLWAAVSGVLLIVLGFVLWNNLKYHFFPKRFGVVEAGRIYRSGQLSPTLVKDTLSRHGIRVIVDLTPLNPADSYQKAELAASRELQIEHLRFPLNGDGTGDIRHYADAVQAVVRADQEHKPVLVHCSAGAQRTGGTIALYRLLIEHKAVPEVLEEMGRYAWKPQDAALPHYLNENMAEVTRLLVERGVLEKAPDPLPVFEEYK